MPRTITIQKDASSNRVRLNPSPLQAVISDDSDPDGRFRILIRAGEDLNNLSGPDKSVTFNFLNNASRNRFEPAHDADGNVVPAPFRLNPGESIILTLKQSGQPGLAAIAKRAAGATRFSNDADGHPDPQFTLTASFTFTNPERAGGAGHNDAHMEC